MNKNNILKSITPTSSLDIIDANGIELFASDGKIYYDLNEISMVLGQKNQHFADRISACLYGVTSMKSGNSPNKQKFYQYLSDTTNHRFQYLLLRACQLILFFFVLAFYQVKCKSKPQSELP